MQIKYLRDKNGHPYATFWTDGKKFGWSLCHKDDKFIKKVGVAIARIHAIEYGELVAGVRNPPQSICDQFFNWVMSEKSYYANKHNSEPKKYSRIITDNHQNLLMRGTNVIATFKYEDDLNEVLEKLN
jgi:hypothetical protein